MGLDDRGKCGASKEKKNPGAERTNGKKIQPAYRISVGDDLWSHWWKKSALITSLTLQLLCKYVLLTEPEVPTVSTATYIRIKKILR